MKLRLSRGHQLELSTFLTKKLPWTQFLIVKWWQHLMIKYSNRRSF